MMRRTGSIVAAALMLGVGVPIVAQEAPGTIGQVFVTRVKAGVGKQYQEGPKRHMAWHKKQGDSWTWSTWEVASGPDTGSHPTFSLGPPWEDLHPLGANVGPGRAPDGDPHRNPHSEPT